jgi:hypothetical protein
MGYLSLLESKKGWNYSRLAVGSNLFDQNWSADTRKEGHAEPTLLAGEGLNHKTQGSTCNKCVEGITGDQQQLLAVFNGIEETMPAIYHTGAGNPVVAPVTVRELQAQPISIL